jgi:N-acetyl-anhydromuramyl-L-alanine amidase AmpD
MNRLHSLLTLSACAALALTVSGCKTAPRTGDIAPRTGDEIVVAGKFVHTGTRVVTWMDPGGYDAYRVERRFSPVDKAGWKETETEDPKYMESPNRYNMRHSTNFSAVQVEQLRGGGWDLPTLQDVVDQFVLHFDVCGTSRQCFKILHDRRDLSVHFMLDIDGTIYQTLDVKERAWHATSSNSRSVGIEIANMGAYPVNGKNPFAEWYKKGADGQTILTLPPEYGDGGLYTKGFVGHPARPNPVVGEIQGKELIQYDYTPQQYQALVHLTAALCQVLPKIKCDYPKDAQGKLIRTKLPDAELEAYQGILGHYHIQMNKVDPGPALQWDYLVKNARKLMHGRACQDGFSPMANQTSLGHMRQNN